MGMAYPSSGLLAMVSIAWVNAGIVVGPRVLVECLPVWRKAMVGLGDGLLWEVDVRASSTQP